MATDKRADRGSVDEASEIDRLRNNLRERELDLEVQCQAMREMLGELEESRSRYAELYDYAPVGYMTHDGKGCIREINLAGASMLGMERPRLLGMPLTVFVAKSSHRIFFAHLRSCRLAKTKVITEMQLVPKNMAAIHVQIISIPLPGKNGAKDQFRSIIADITERKRLEQEMLRLDRLDIVGQMAAGIAHEIRNPMTTVRGYLQTFLQRDEFIRQRSQLNLMITELDRANSIITEYLGLARGRTVDLSPQDLNDIIKTLLPLIESDALLHNKWITTELAAEVPPLLLDSQQMRQLILNLTKNGLEAMATGGQLTIGTVVKDGSVCLFIRDQGGGIPADILAKLGTPFITTKAGGTGLGLPICYSIVQHHNAKMEVETGASGTTFCVRFPLP